MKHECTTADSQEAAALYALGALSQHEARAFAAHLNEGCTVCDLERRQFDEVVGVLGSAAPAATPPSYVRDLLAVRIEREVSEARPSGSVIRFPEQPGATRRQPAQSSSLFGALLPWAVAAALLIVSIFSFAMWRSEHNSSQALIDRAASEGRAESEGLRAKLKKENATSKELTEINTVLSSPRWRIISLAGQDVAPDSSAKIYWDVQSRRWAISADLPPAPEGKVYQLWFVTPAAKISAGLIKPDETGHCFAVLGLPDDLSLLAAAAITLEPEGGSQQPTSKIYVLGNA